MSSWQAGILPWQVPNQSYININFKRNVPNEWLGIPMQFLQAYIKLTY